MLFPFDILPEAGFDLYGDNVRAYINRIAEVLENPCLGQRLRHPSSAPDSEARWDDFCKLNLPRRLRLIYIWNPEETMIAIVGFGPHLGHGKLGDVYDGVAELFDLPDDEGHAQLPAESCCTDADAAGRTISREAGHEQILRMAKR